MNAYASSALTFQRLLRVYLRLPPHPGVNGSAVKGRVVQISLDFDDSSPIPLSSILIVEHEAYLQVIYTPTIDRLTGRCLRILAVLWDIVSH